MSADKTVGDEKAGRAARRPSFLPQRKSDPARSVTSAGKAKVITTAPAKKPVVKTEDQEPQEPKRGGNLITNVAADLREYAEGVRSELRKVTWPTREETTRLTIIVLIALIATAILLGAIVLVYTELFRVGLDRPEVLIVFMLIAAAVGFFINRSQNRPSGFQR
jgi:preprotein translocase subunit SecE